MAFMASSCRGTKTRVPSQDCCSLLFCGISAFTAQVVRSHQNSIRFYVSPTGVGYVNGKLFLNFCFGPWEGPSYLQRLCAGGTAGALAISVFNPAEAHGHNNSGLPVLET